MTACQRCGRSDGSHVGYHKHDELPIKAGDRVVLLPGVHAETRGKVKVIKRRQVVTVHYMDIGSSEISGESVHHLTDPCIVWAGSDGYWHSAKLSDVQLQLPNQGDPK